MYPAALNISSNGTAGTAQSSRLGVYLKNNSQQYNNRPVYQLDRGGEYLWYDDDGTWGFGSTLGGDVGIYAPQKGILTPPATGWRYYDSETDEFIEDPQLTVSGETIIMFGVCH